MFNTEFTNSLKKIVNVYLQRSLAFIILKVKVESVNAFTYSTWRLTHQQRLLLDTVLDRRLGYFGHVCHADSLRDHTLMSFKRVSRGYQNTGDGDRADQDVAAYGQLSPAGVLIVHVGSNHSATLSASSAESSGAD